MHAVGSGILIASKALTWCFSKDYTWYYKIIYFEGFKLIVEKKQIKSNFSIIEKSFVVVLSVVFLGISGCTGETTGQLLGGSMGALIGSQIGGGKGNVIATALGAVAGVALGGALGKQFDKRDQEKAKLAAEKAAASGQAVQWTNPSTGACGTWQPGPMQYGANHQPYRQLKCLATQPDGKPVNLFVNAYQGADGNWYMAQ